MQTLHRVMQVSVLCDMYDIDDSITHNPLRRKIPASCKLQDRSMRRFQINGKGSRTVTKSQTTLIARDTS